MLNCTPDPMLKTMDSVKTVNIYAFIPAGRSCSASMGGSVFLGYPCVPDTFPASKLEDSHIFNTRGEILCQFFEQVLTYTQKTDLSTLVNRLLTAPPDPQGEQFRK